MEHTHIDLSSIISLLQVLHKIALSEWIQQHHVTAAYHTLQGVAARTARASGLLGISSAPALCHLSPLSSLSAAGAVGRARNKPVIVQLTGTVWQVRMLDS